MRLLSIMVRFVSFLFLGGLYVCITCFFYAHTGDKTGAEHDEEIATYRDQFEMIIKTDGEGSLGLSLRRQSISAPSSVRVVGRHPGASLRLGDYIVDQEQQMRKNERTTDWTDY